MTQRVILNQFIKYLDIKSRQYLKELGNHKSASKRRKRLIQIEKEKHLAHIKKIKEYLKKGNCHGFVICHAAMDCIGKGEWWENVLVTLDNWDGTEEALKKDVILPGSISTDNYKSLDYLFNRALNYIMYHQVDVDFIEESGFGLKGLEQVNLLKPVRNNNDHNYFEIVAADNQSVAVIKNAIVAAGHFTSEDLLALLEGDQIQGNICKMATYDHTVRIGYTGNDWIFYNSNDDHLQLETIHKVDTKEEIVTEVIRILETNDLTLTIASLEERTLVLPHFEEMLKNRKIDLLRECGFHRLVKFRPDCINECLAFATEQKSSELAETIANALLKQNEDHWTGLHMLIRYGKGAINQLFQWVEQTKDKELFCSIVDAFLVTIKDVDSGLLMLANHEPKSIVKLFHLGEQMEDHRLRKRIESFFTTRENEDGTGFHLLAHRAPDEIKEMLQYALHKKDQALIAAILKALPEKDKKNQAAFSLIAKWDDFPHFVKAVLSNENELYENLQTIIHILATAYDKDQTGWNILFNTQNFKSILVVIEKSLDNLTQEQLIDLGKKLRTQSYTRNSEYIVSWCKDTNHSVFSQANVNINIWHVLLNKTKDKLKECSKKSVIQKISKMQNSI